MTDERPVVLFDLDGTLADFDAGMRAAMGRIGSPGDPPWDPDREAAEPQHIKARRRLIKSLPGFWTGLSPMDDGFEILRMAHEIGFRLMVLSRGPSQNPLAWQEKIVWCRANIPYDHQITLTEDKGLVYGRVLVDDWPPYIEDWLAYRPRGQVIMPARSWNASYKRPSNVHRFVHMTESTRITRALLQRQFDRRIGEAGGGGDGWGL
jgi:5'-nucleotidase